MSGPGIPSPTGPQAPTEPAMTSTLPDVALPPPVDVGASVQSLIAITAVALLALLALRMWRARRPSAFRLVDRLDLGRGSFLAAVGIGERVWVVGVQRDRLELLGEIDGDEIPAESRPEPLRFDAWMQLLKRRPTERS